MELLQSMASLPKKDTGLRMQSRARRQAALEKTSELQKTVDGWDQRDVGQCCNEFIRGMETRRRFITLAPSLNLRNITFSLLCSFSSYRGHVGESE